MKNKLCGFLSAVCISAICAASLNLYGCSGGKQEIDYDVSTLEIREEQRFAPCYFMHFVCMNEYTAAYFEDFFKYEFNYKGSFDRVTIDGKEWSTIKLYQERLPEGKYKIIISADKKSEESEYEKTIALNVSVSARYRDLYGEEEYEEWINSRL